MTTAKSICDVRAYTLLVLGTTAFASGAHAQDPGTQRSGDEVETVVVTGRAGAEDRRKVETSYSITTIDNEALRMDAPLGVADALQSVPGFWVESSGGEASANIRARGIPQEGYSAVALLEDGLPIQHDAGLGWLNADQSYRLDDTVERVEVVRGGPASIFASNAPGGVVNFITRRPGSTPEGSLKLETSDYGLMRLDGWYGAPVGEWRLGFGGFYREDDGIRDPGYTANEGGQLRLSLGRELTRGSIDFNLKHIDDNVIFYTGLPLTYDGDGDITGVPGIDARFGTLAGPETAHVQLRDADGVFPLDVTRGTDVQLTQLTMKLDYELTGGWRLQNGLRYRDSDVARIGLFPNTPVSAQRRLEELRPTVLATVPGATDVQLRYVSSPQDVFDVVNQNGNGLTTIGSLRQVSTPLEEWMNDLRLMRVFESGGQRHDVVLGLYFARVEESFQRYSANALLDVRDRARMLDIVAVDVDGNALATVTDHGIIGYGSEFANGSGHSTTWALYASDEWQILEPLRLDLGIRWERVEVKGRHELFEERDLGVLPGIADDRVLTGTGEFASFDRDFDDLGWTAGVNWQLDRSSGLFARYTSVYRLPSVGSFITSANAQPVIQTASFVEAGYKYAGERLSLFATVFDTRYDSYGFTERLVDPVTGQVVTRTVYTDTDTIGLELEGRYRPVSWLDIGFSAMWQDPQFGHLTDNIVENGQLIVRDYTGNRLIRVPKISYRLTPAVTLLNERLRLELDYQHYGDRYSDAANSVELPDYGVLSANVRFRVTPAVTLYLRGENLTNEVGLTEGNPRAGQFQSGEADSPFFVGRPIYGRNYRLSMLWQF